jgi:hypothetical protein
MLRGDDMQQYFTSFLTAEQVEFMQAVLTIKAAPRKVMAADCLGLPRIASDCLGLPPSSAVLTIRAAPRKPAHSRTPTNPDAPGRTRTNPDEPRRTRTNPDEP